MCLYSKSFLPRRTKNEITVYKVVRTKKVKGKSSRDLFFTPVTKVQIFLGYPFTAKGPKRAKLTQYRYLVPGLIFNNNVMCGVPKWAENTTDIVYTVEDGYIHCVESLGEAEYWRMKNSGLFPWKKWAIIACTIPKGTLYFKSWDGYTLCARTILPRKVVLHG